MDSKGRTGGGGGIVVGGGPQDVRILLYFLRCSLKKENDLDFC